jgi:hypothetical protein
MTDVLTERFAALADTSIAADWLDVRRRIRRRRTPIALLVAIPAALIVVAVALAINGGWIFRGGKESFGTNTVQFHGKAYTLNAYFSDGRMLCLILGRGPARPFPFVHSASYVASACGVSTLSVPGVAQETFPKVSPTSRPFGATRWDAAGGQIWFGDSRPSIRRIVITDDKGKTFTAETAAPMKPKLALRVWVLALPSSEAQSIAGYDAAGKLILRRSPYGIADLGLH